MRCDACTNPPSTPQEASLYNNMVLVSHEGDNFELLSQWEPVTDADVQTPREVRPLGLKPVSFSTIQCHEASFSAMQ